MESEAEAYRFSNNLFTLEKPWQLIGWDNQGRNDFRRI